MESWKQLLLERRAVRTPAVGRNYQAALGSFLKFVLKRTLPLVEDGEIDGALVACSKDGFLRGVQPLWLQETSEVSSMRCLRGLRLLTPARTRRAVQAPVWEGIAAQLTLLKRHCSTTHCSQSSPYGNVRPHLAGDVQASFRTSGTEKEGSCPTACATSSLLVGRDRSFPKLEYTKTEVRDVSVLMDQRWLQLVRKLLPAFTAGNLEEEIWNVDCLAAAKMVKTATDTLGLSGMTLYQQTSAVEPAWLGCAVSDQNPAREEMQRRGQWRAFNSHNIRQKHSSATVSPRPLRNKL